MKFNLEKMFMSRVKNMKSILEPNNLPRLVLMLAILVGLYLLYINYLKEGFESTSEDLESQLGQGKKLVLFYADWCGHCKTLKPIWDDASTQVNTDDKRMIKVNCGEGSDADKKLMEKYSIDGYPTIILFVDGNPTPYSGKRNKEDFIEVFS